MISKVTNGVARLRHILGIDRAIGFTVMARVWRIVSGFATILLIAHFLTPEEQGYYYTFASLVALQTVFELGFSFVILQLAAHETAQLTIEANGEIHGDEAAHSRLASILKKSVHWYSIAAFLMAVVLVIVGFYFFSHHGQHSGHIAWKTPWICAVIATFFTFQIDPVLSFLEGCGFVPQVAGMRFAQAVTGTTLAWLALLINHGLFAPAGVIFGQAIAGIGFLVSKRRLLLPLLQYKLSTHIVSWSREIWPFQWRIAVSSISCYLIYPLFSPVLFTFRGATEAGRMGMSLNIANALGALAQAWINTKASPFGSMVARRDFASLDRVFSRALIQSGALLLFGETCVVAGLYFVGQYSPHLADRMLPIPIFALLLFSIFLNHVAYSEAIYLRAHKQEPFLYLAMAVGLLTGISTVVNGKFWGTTGIVVGYFICGGLFYAIGGSWIFMRLRRLWHETKQESEVSREII